MGKLVSIAIILALIFGGWNLLANGWHLNTGSGEHTGYITAVEKSGVFWKTGTAYIKTDVSSSQEDRYCISDPAVYSRLEELSRSQARITVRYVEYLIKGFTVCNGEQAIITEIK